MEAQIQEHIRRLAYVVNDVISVPEDVPDLGVQKGDEGIIRELTHRDTVITALVEVPFSTGLTKGWVSIQTMPEKKLVSYARAS